MRKSGGRSPKRRGRSWGPKRDSKSRCRLKATTDALLDVESTDARVDEVLTLLMLRSRLLEGVVGGERVGADFVAAGTAGMTAPAELGRNCTLSKWNLPFDSGTVASFAEGGGIVSATTTLSVGGVLDKGSF